MADAERLRRQAEQSPAKVPSKEDIMRQIAHVHEILADPNISYEIKRKCPPAR